MLIATPGLPTSCSGLESVARIIEIRQTWTMYDPAVPADADFSERPTMIFFPWVEGMTVG